MSPLSAGDRPLHRADRLDLVDGDGERARARLRRRVVVRRGHLHRVGAGRDGVRNRDGGRRGAADAGRRRLSRDRDPGGRGRDGGAEARDGAVGIGRGDGPRRRCAFERRQRATAGGDLPAGSPGDHHGCEPSRVERVAPAKPSHSIGPGSQASRIVRVAGRDRAACPRSVLSRRVLDESRCPTRGRFEAAAGRAQSFTTPPLRRRTRRRRSQSSRSRSSGRPAARFVVPPAPAACWTR